MDLMFSEFFKDIKENAKVCIYGTGYMTEVLLEKLKTLRPDVEVKFLINTNEEGEKEGLPIYKAENLDKCIGQVDTGIVASYGSRLYLEVILRGFGLENIHLVSKEMIEKYGEKFVETKSLNKRDFDVEKSASVFKTKQDRDLYHLVAKARKDWKKFGHLIFQKYNEETPEKLYLYSPKHYFEFINKDTIKTVIDGGGAIGLQSICFTQKFPNCEKVYVFEPDYEFFKSKVLDNIMKRNSKIEIVNKALWNENATLEFREDLTRPAASKLTSVCKSQQQPSANVNIIKVEATNIDYFVEQNKIEKVDFIKMDVENSEQAALIGAEETLLNHRPQLAISIYHSDEQFYEIPLYLRELLTDYEFSLGHYSSGIGETVLYAIPKELVKE